jgi:hypothetical protein
MIKKWLWVGMALIFVASYLISKNNLVMVNWDKLGQVVGLGAVVAGYFGAKAWKKISPTLK